MLICYLIFYSIFFQNRYLLPRNTLLTYLPLVIILLIGIVGLYLVYRISDKNQRVAILTSLCINNTGFAHLIDVKSRFLHQKVFVKLYQRFTPHPI